MLLVDVSHIVVTTALIMARLHASQSVFFVYFRAAARRRRSVLASCEVLPTAALAELLRCVNCGEIEFGFNIVVVVVIIVVAVPPCHGVKRTSVNFSY